MTTYRPYLNFTAQAKNMLALNNLYSQMNRDPNLHTEITPIVVFLAFTIESYLNSIGSRKIEFWDELERLPWRSKVSILHKAANQTPDWGRDPLQFAQEIFSLRDKLAHGKPETVYGRVCSTEAEAGSQFNGEAFQPEWYEGLSKEWANMAYARLWPLTTYLASLFGLHASDCLKLSDGGIQTDDGSIA